MLWAREAFVTDESQPVLAKQLRRTKYLDQNKLEGRQND
jgi:hypothetical protein